MNKHNISCADIFSTFKNQRFHSHSQRLSQEKCVTGKVCARVRGMGGGGVKKKQKVSQVQDT